MDAAFYLESNFFSSHCMLLCFFSLLLLVALSPYMGISVVKEKIFLMAKKHVTFFASHIQVRTATFHGWTRKSCLGIAV